MEIKSRSAISVSIIELTGRFDAHTVKPVDEWLSKTIQGTKPQIVVNLVGVNFLDSTALALLVRFAKHAREKTGDLRLCNLQPPIRVIFELTRLDRAFEIFPTEDPAVQSYTGT